MLWTVEAVDAFVAAHKTLVGDGGWVCDPNEDQCRLKYTIAMDGVPTASTLEIIDFPLDTPRSFTITVNLPPCVWRLDFDAPPKGHTNDVPEGHECPRYVRGPHYHPWALNRQFHTGKRPPEELPLALPLSPAIKSYKSALDWFCSETENHIREKPATRAAASREAHMNLTQHISSAFAPVPDADGVLVPTPILYPSNGNVVVHVSGGSRTCVVSDRGDALRNARAHAVEIPNIDHWLTLSLRGSSLRGVSGQITSSEMKLEDVFSGIALVARAASDAVRYAIEHYKRSDETIYDRTYRELTARFGAPNVSRQTTAIGASNRNYHFDFAAPIGARLLLIDTVLPNANSVNAKAIAHIDVGNLKEKSPFHSIVYDADADWDASDINLLQSAAQLLPVGRLSKELGRYEKLN